MMYCLTTSNISIPSTVAAFPHVKFVLLQNFSEYNMWLAAENGMFLRSTNGVWMTTMPEHLNMDWVDSVKVWACVASSGSASFSSNFSHSSIQHVFEYFTERTPRSHFEQRETSLVWNYKYSGDLSFIIHFPLKNLSIAIQSLVLP